MIIDGKSVADSILDNLANTIKSYNGRKPHLAVILVGDDPASKIYVRNKERACKRVGIINTTIRLQDTCSEKYLLDLINELNLDNAIDGILVQLPLPKHISEEKVINAINPLKDVDGFHPMTKYVPCTPKGVLTLIDSTNIDIQGKHVVVVGRSHNVGLPIALLCLGKNATVTIAHSKTNNLQEVCRSADVLISAVGKPKLITRDFVKPNAIIIDVGINRDENGKLCGDCDFEAVKDIASYITPVPGGCGPMTIACLMDNTLEACINKVENM